MLGKMSDSAALVERMSTAVRTAYKAIEVLKEENKALKAENDALKLEIANLRGRAPQDNQPGNTTEGRITELTLQKVHTSDPLGQSFQLKASQRKDIVPITKHDKPAVLPTVAPQPTNTDVTLYARVSSLCAEEFGQQKPQCNLKFVNSPDSKRIFSVLSQLSEFNVHAMARAISEISMETVSKALMSTVASYFSMEVLTSWGNMLASESLLSSSGYLLPKALLTRLDLLCTLLSSIGSRTTNGLIRVGKLVAIVKKVILGSIRCQLESPHFAVAVGTLRSHRVSPSQPATLPHGKSEQDTEVTGDNERTDDHIKTEDVDGADTNHDAGDSEDEDSRGHFGVPEEALSDSEEESYSGSEDGDAEEHKPVARPSLAAWGHARRGSETQAGVSSGAAIVPQSEQKAALSSMFGLDSSDDDEEEENEEEGGGMTNDNDVSFTNDNDDTDAMEIVNDHDFGAEEKSQVAVSSATTVAEGLAVVAGAVNHATPINTKGSDTLEHASKLYVLLAALVRLRLVHELVSALRELRLVTAGNCSAGAVIGTVAVLGSQRFRALSLPGVASEVKELLVQWHGDFVRMMSHNGTNIDPSAVTAMKSEDPVSRSLAKSLVVLIETFWAALDLSRPLPALPASTELSTLVGELPGHAAQETMDAQLLAHQFRQLGFWGSLVAMTNITSASASAFTVGVSGPLGLDKLPGHSLAVQEIVSSWDPAAMHAPHQGHRQHVPSLKDFVNSDAYLFSTLQGVVQQTVKNARIQQTKLITEDLLVEELAAHWKDHLSSPAFQASGAHKGIQLMHELLQNFLSTDYDASEGGWRCGAGGEGFRLSSRLDNRLTVGLALLKKLAECGGSAEHFIGSSAMLALKPSLQWLHFSSLSGRKLLEYAEFVDHCTSEVFHKGVPSNATSGLTSTELVRHITEGKLYAVCCEIVALLALSSIEALVSVFVSSLRGLLLAVRKVEGGSGKLDMIVSLVDIAIITLTALPSPWAGIARADIQQEILLTSRHLAGTRSTSSIVSSEERQDWLTQLASALPVFVINLDKRADRWRRLLIMLDQATFSAVRIRAFDGTSGDATSSITPAEMFQRNFAANTSDSTLPVPRAMPRLEDAYSSIPESDVQLTWDSTLNNKFDPRCPVNTRTVATQSERACAASHLRVWRAIAAARGTKAAKSKLRGLQSLAAESSDTLSERAFASAEDIYKSLNSLQLGKGRPPAVKSTTPAPAEAACSQNQIALVEDAFCEEGTDYFIILEDDVSFPQQSLVDLRATVRSIMRVLPASVDILYLCGVLPKACSDFKLKNIKGDPFFSINYAWTLQAYVLRSRAVEVLLAKLPIFAPVDNFVASLVYHGELRACIVKDKLTQRLTGPVTPGGGRKTDSDVRPSGRSYSGLPKRPISTPTADSNAEGNKKKKIDRRKRRKH